MELCVRIFFNKSLLIFVGGDWYVPWSPFDGSLPSFSYLYSPLMYVGGDFDGSNGDASLSCPLFINVEKTQIRSAKR